MKRTTYPLALSAILILSSCHEENVIEKEPRLDYYIESYEVDNLGFEPLLKVACEYQESGKLDKYTVLSYNPDTDATVEQRHFVFSYTDDHVGQIKGYLPDAATPYIEYSYEYLEGNEVSKIAEVNHGTGTNSDASFAYAEDGTIKVSYIFSNGGSFEYEFNFATGNISTDKTTRGAQLCSEGRYTYDQYHNPFKDLGYVDYLLTNLCDNNRLTENVNYVACAFPSLIPESYSYEYNDRGFPVSVTTAYRSAESMKRSKREFFYR